jgi:hypothetical protein
LRSLEVFEDGVRGVSVRVVIAHAEQRARADALLGRYALPCSVE